MYLSITSTSHCSWGKSGSWQVPDVAAPLEASFLDQIWLQRLDFWSWRIRSTPVDNSIFLQMDWNDCFWFWKNISISCDSSDFLFVCFVSSYCFQERGKEETILRLTNEPLVWSLESHVFVESLNQMPSWLRNRKLVEQAFMKFCLDENRMKVSQKVG